MVQSAYWWIFVSLVPVIYWCAPLRFRAAILTCGSIATLIAIAPGQWVVLLGLGALIWGICEVVARERALAVSGGVNRDARHSFNPFWATGAPVLILLSCLIWFKYLPALASIAWPTGPFTRAAAPLGMSYLCLKLMHFAIERSRGTLPPHRPTDYLSWLFLLPTFSAGPIERFDHFVTHRETTFKSAFLVEGGSRIAQGFVKKFVLSAGVDAMAHKVIGIDPLVFARSGAGGLYGIAETWAFLALNLCALYLDFSAYSDIAIGASRLFGLRIAENFNYPLLATNLGEFWRRWHMSLTGWCRAYVFMPLVGMTRNPTLAIIVNFAAVGLWHAASLQWLAWGLWNGCGMAFLQRWSRFAQKRRIVFTKTAAGKAGAWLLTLAFVTLGDALVALNDASLVDSLRLMRRAVGF